MEEEPVTIDTPQEEQPPLPPQEESVSTNGEEASSKKKNRHRSKTTRDGKKPEEEPRSSHKKTSKSKGSKTKDDSALKQRPQIEMPNVPRDFGDLMENLQQIEATAHEEAERASEKIMSTTPDGEFQNKLSEVLRNLQDSLLNAASGLSQAFDGQTAHLDEIGSVVSSFAHEWENTKANVYEDGFKKVLLPFDGAEYTLPSAMPALVKPVSAYGPTAKMSFSSLPKIGCTADGSGSLVEELPEGGQPCSIFARKVVYFTRPNPDVYDPFSPRDIQKMKESFVLGGVGDTPPPKPAPPPSPKSGRK